MVDKDNIEDSRSLKKVACPSVGGTRNIIADKLKVQSSKQNPEPRTPNTVYMFLIAGVQPKTRRVDDNPQRCPACGLAQAFTTRVDHYLSLFFIPLIRVKQGEPFLLCEACQRPLNGNRAPVKEVPLSGASTVCVACKSDFDSSFKYCPYCGQRA